MNPGEYSLVCEIPMSCRNCFVQLLDVDSFELAAAGRFFEFSIHETEQGAW